jgi:CheY-like chemotaxis protein
MPHTLLLADDSVTIQRVIELTFADEDVRVVAVSNGEQAIAAMDEDPPDIVLADVGMPGRNGYEVAQYMKDTPRLAHIPVLLLTGAFEPIDRERAAAVACDGVLAKPFEPQQVIARVRALLSGPRNGAGDLGMPGETAVAGTPPQSQAGVDEYFSRLDEAFAELTGAIPTAPAVLDPADRLAPKTSVGVSAPTPVPHADVRRQNAVVALPSLAEAFAALLAAEQSTPESAAQTGWPALVPPEALIEDVTRRVLERLSDTVVKAAVADVVSSVAERLVREEIERIKASIDDTPDGPDL